MSPNLHSIRVCPTSRTEISRIQRTLIVYPPEGTDNEVWYFYPMGFETLYAPDNHTAVYATDPDETIAPDYERESLPCYYARADRQLGAMTLRDVGLFYGFLKNTPPKGILSIPGFFAPGAPQLPSSLPDREVLKADWILYLPDAGGRFPLDVHSGQN